jgi:hypothetical protein
VRPYVSFPGIARRFHVLARRVTHITGPAGPRCHLCSRFGPTNLLDVISRARCEVSAGGGKRVCSRAVRDGVSAFGEVDGARSDRELERASTGAIR